MFTFQAENRFYAGFADFADEGETIFALIHALFGNEAPLPCFIPFFCKGIVAGDAVVQNREQLAHLRGGICYILLAVLGEHVLQDIGRCCGGSKGRAWIVLLLQAVFYSLLGELRE